MNFETIAVSKAGPVCRIAVNRPQARNALNESVRAELSSAIAMAAEDRDIRAIILTGAGRAAFAAGTDIRDMIDCDPGRAEQLSHGVKALHDAIRHLCKPVIASVHGYCLGGGFELALACDLRIASETAKFGLPEIKLGIMPGAGGTVGLTRLVGPGWARRLCMTGEIIDAERALSLGIVTDLHPADALDDAADRLAGDLAALSRSAMRQLKAALNAVADCDRETAEALEIKAFALCFASPDQREGMLAFLEKRKPSFA